jgi:hypothetical protein
MRGATVNGRAVGKVAICEIKPAHGAAESFIVRRTDTNVLGWLSRNDLLFVVVVGPVGVLRLTSAGRFSLLITLNPPNRTVMFI